MPIDFMNIKNLPEEAKKDGLPGGNAKGKSYRGTLAWWVMTVLFSTTITLLWNANSNFKQQIKELKIEKDIEVQKKDAAIERLINKLEGITSKVYNVEERVDTLTEKSLLNEKSFKTSKKLLKNAIQ